MIILIFLARKERRCRKIKLTLKDFHLEDMKNQSSKEKIPGRNISPIERFKIKYIFNKLNKRFLSA
jgi:hypothetical protein